MYHLFESEMKSISAFNGVALACFSVFSALLNVTVAIFIGWGFSATPLSEFGDTMIHKGVWYVLLLALIFLLTGVYAIYTRMSVVKQIKNETKTPRAEEKPS